MYAMRMEISTLDNSQLLAQQLREHNKDRFLQTLYVPPSARAGLSALYALEMELSHVHGAVREEMIGHIRYAWWQEAIEGLYAGKPARGHPVLEELKPLVSNGQLPQAEVLALVTAFRESFPEVPPNAAALTDEAAQALLAQLALTSIAKWKKAGKIIACHRQKHPRGAYGRLALRLLLV